MLAWNRPYCQYFTGPDYPPVLGKNMFCSVNQKCSLIRAISQTISHNQAANVVSPEPINHSPEIRIVCVRVCMPMFACENHKCNILTLVNSSLLKVQTTQHLRVQLCAVQREASMLFCLFHCLSGHIVQVNDPLTDNQGWRVTDTQAKRDNPGRTASVPNGALIPNIVHYIWPGSYVLWPKVDSPETS